MTKDDVEKLFLYFAQIYPNKTFTENMKYAWELSLKPYPYETVREAAGKFRRENKFFPDVDELVALMPKSKSKLEMRPYVEKLSDDYGKHISPSHYAREHGMTWEQARDELVKKGLYTTGS